MSLLTRRAVLCGTAAACGTAALAGCAPASTDPEATGDPAAPEAGDGSAPEAGDGSAPEAGDDSAPETGDDEVPTPPDGALARLDDVPDGGVVAAKTPDGRPVLLSRNGDEVTGVSAVCTHDGCTVAPSGNCPCHGSQFDPRTGAVSSGPAQSDLDPIPLQVVDGEVRPA